MNKLLIHVGYPKAGSCFLGDWFHRHPDFIFKDFAIAGFNNTDDLMNISSAEIIDDKKIFVIRDMRFSAPYASDFNNLEGIDIYQQKVAKTLFSLFPHAKVLIVTRGFESAIKAYYSQYLKKGGFVKFDKYIETGRSSHWLPFNYSFLINLYTDLFGSENVLVIPFESLKIDPSLFLGKIETFLGLEPFLYQPEINNQSLSPKNMTLFRKMNKFIYFALFIFGPLQLLFHKLYIKLLNKNQTKSWNNFVFAFFSRFFKPTEFDCFATNELKEKFSIHAQGLKDQPDYQKFKKDYFIN
jgi:hypothetical protein